LKGKLVSDVYRCIHVYSEQLGCKVVELNVQMDHVHLVVKVPPEALDIQFTGSAKN
jgi:putative transposase